MNDKLSARTKKSVDGDEVPLSYFSVQGEYLYGMMNSYAGSGLYDNGEIYRRKKNGKKFTKLADGTTFLVSGKYIFYVKLEGFYNLDWKGNSIWRMDLDGKNKKRIKYIKGNHDEIGYVHLYKSNKNIYYGYSTHNEDFKYFYNLFSLDGKRIKGKYIIDNFDGYYLKEVKKKIYIENNQLKVGSFKKGRWEFKTILKSKKNNNIWRSHLPMIKSFSGIGKYILIIRQKDNSYNENLSLDLYDINGRFIKRLKSNFGLSR